MSPISRGSRTLTTGAANGAPPAVTTCGLAAAESPPAKAVPRSLQLEYQSNWAFRVPATASSAVATTTSCDPARRRCARRRALSWPLPTAFGQDRTPQMKVAAATSHSTQMVRGSESDIRFVPPLLCPPCKGTGHCRAVLRRARPTKTGSSQIANTSRPRTMPGNSVPQMPLFGG